MTLAIGERRAWPGGFSLMEMVVSLAIIAILSGYFVLRFGESQQEKLLAPPAAELRLLSLQALRQASAYREEYAMLFSQQEMALVRGRGAKGERVESIAVPVGVTVLLRRAGEEKWIEANGEPWLFRPAGLCEPMEVRLAAADAFIELAFEPLTARAEETAYYP